MGGKNTRTFQRTELFKFLVTIFGIFLILMMCLFIVISKPNIMVTFGYIVLIVILALGFLVMVTEKIVVTSDEIIRSNVLKKDVIPLHVITSIKIGRIRNMHLLYVFTGESEIALHGGATKKQLHEMMEYILEQVRLNNPEHYKRINFQQSEVEAFWRR